MVQTELTRSINDPARAAEIEATWSQPGHALVAADVAELVAYIIGAPDNVAVSEVKIHSRGEG